MLASTLFQFTAVDSGTKLSLRGFGEAGTVEAQLLNLILENKNDFHISIGSLTSRSFNHSLLEQIQNSGRFLVCVGTYSGVRFAANEMFNMNAVSVMEDACSIGTLSSLTYLIVSERMRNNLFAVLSSRAVNSNIVYKLGSDSIESLPILGTRGSFSYSPSSTSTESVPGASVVLPSLEEVNVLPTSVGHPGLLGKTLRLEFNQLPFGLREDFRICTVVATQAGIAEYISQPYMIVTHIASGRNFNAFDSALKSFSIVD